MVARKHFFNSLHWIALLLFLSFQSCKSLKIPTIYDGEKYGALSLDVNLIEQPMDFNLTGLPDSEMWMPKKYYKKYPTIEKLLKESKTTSFLVMKDGEVICEQYAQGMQVGDLTQVFSVTKVFVTAALGIAIQEGKIKSLNQKISEFLPEFEGQDMGDITLFHLAQMQSGLAYDEYRRVFQTLKFYHTRDVNELLESPKLKREPGSKFLYKSIDTQILAKSIEQAVGVPLVTYIQERILNRLGMQDSVLWSVDSEEAGNPKYYGGLNMSARDLAKFGQLILDDGVKDGQQILSPMTLSFCLDENCMNDDGKYCNGWWYNTWDEEKDVFFAAGFKGQILMVNRTDNVVIVRLGESKGGVKWYDMLRELSEVIPSNYHMQEDIITKK